MDTHRARETVLQLVGASVLTAAAMGPLLAGCFLETDGEILTAWDSSPIVDTDGDGVPDDQPDNCPTTPNRSQADFDEDGVGNACDEDAVGQDSDADGVDDSIDQCQGDTGGTNEDDDVYPGIPWQIVDDCDNCPSVPNPDQTNGDGDDIGNLCERPEDAGAFANILLFDRLRDDLQGWRILKWSGWSFVSGALVAEPETILHAVAPDEVSAVLTPRYALETILQMDAVSPTESTFAGLLLASTLDGAKSELLSWEGCVLSADPGGSGELLISIRAMDADCSGDACDLGEILRQQATGVGIDFGDTYRLYAARNGNTITCWLGSSSDSVDARVSVTASDMSTGGPGLTAAGTTTRFLSATIYGP